MATADDAKRLLLVQHKGSDWEELIKALEGLGYGIEKRIGAAEGLSAFLKEDFTAVLLELRDEASWQDLDEMANDERGATIIVISHKLPQVDIVEALRRGASDYWFVPRMEVNGRFLGPALDRALQQGVLRQENLRYRYELENANRELLESLTHLKQDQQAGRHIQIKMLPETPKVLGNYRFHHHILPSLYLSGDFIDYFLVGDRHAVFFVADVSGHGASSAFVTVMLKNLFARKRSDYHHRHTSAILSPAHMLDKANRELLGMEIDKHVTMCVGVIDLQSDELCYSIAGHLPAPVISVDGTARYLEGHDLPVGLFPEAIYTEHRMQLPAKAVLTLFSDGILEVLSPAGVIAKEQSLLEALEYGPQSADDVIRTFELDSIGEAPDDIAVLVVSRV